MTIRRYELFTNIDNAQVINLSDIETIPNRDLERSTTHDIYTDNPIQIRVKINNDFRDFEASANGFNRIEFAYLKDIQLIGSVNGTVIELIGSDQKSNT